MQSYQIIPVFMVLDYCLVLTLASSPNSYEASLPRQTGETTMSVKRWGHEVKFISFYLSRKHEQRFDGVGCSFHVLLLTEISEYT